MIDRGLGLMFLKRFLGYLLFVFVLFLASMHVAFASNCTGLKVVYPSNNSMIGARSTFFIGSVNPRSKLSINSHRVRIASNGSFVKVVPLKPGVNKLLLKAEMNGHVDSLAYTLNAPTLKLAFPAKPLKIDSSSITPKGQTVYREGDVIVVKFKGSPSAKAYFNFGDNANIPMRELPYKEAGIRGMYQGSYVIKSQDVSDHVNLSVVLKSGDSVITHVSGANIKVISKNQIVVGVVKTDNAPVRVVPGGDRLTPLPKDVKISIVAASAGYYKFKLSDSISAWIKASDVGLLSGLAQEPYAEVYDVQTYEDADNSYIKIPMSEKLPLSVQEVNNALVVDIFGAKLKSVLTPSVSGFLKEVQVSQTPDNALNVRAVVNASQVWGYSYCYCGNDLIIKLRKKPDFDCENPLKGQIIAIDPGHGGSETGAVGPTGVPEKTINLAISMFLKEELEKDGAKVVMTRTNDDENPGLYERSEIARKNNALILISVHNNALPDGQDPYKTHGTSVYYYQPHSYLLAKSIDAALVNDLGLKDLGALHGSLALTRPTEPISVLAEVAFMIHPDEYAKLLTPEFQKSSAISIKRGLVEFLKNSSSQ